MGKTVLVAGGAGYIGSHVCKALAAAGKFPVTLDNLSTGHRAAVRFGELIQADVADTQTVSHVVKQYRIEAVIDLAGSIEVAESVQDPLKYYQNNTASKVSFLRTLRACGVKAYVFSSTAAVYGEPQEIPIRESHPCVPKNPYGWSKWMVEQMLRDYATAEGPAFMALRYFNAAGASPEGEIGEGHEPETHLIPRACFAALGKIPALDIYGNDYPTPDGTAIRDYIHVMDLARAHVLAVDALLSGHSSGSYNLGTGKGISIREILDSFSRLGYAVPHQFKPRRIGDPARLVADASAARSALGWSAEWTNVQDIIRTALYWHQQAVT